MSNKTETFYVSVTHFILRLANVQNKFQKANKTKINHNNDNHIELEVSLHFWGIWPTVRPFYLNCMPRFLANSIFGLDYVFSVQDGYICFNLIDLSKKQYIFFIKNWNKGQKLFARNLGMQFRRAFHVRGSYFLWLYGNSHDYSQ